MTCSDKSSDSEVDDTHNMNGGDEEIVSDHETCEKKDLAIDSEDGAVEKREKGMKNKTVTLPKRKIGPQKQKKEIHTYLKKAKKFEIRKLTRRIATLRNLKGTEEQKAKNNRKVEKLLLEIQSMKEFMIDQITDRFVDILKGKCEQIYLDIWSAAQEHKDFEKMLQTLSNGDDADKYDNIAFLRMISSKDILAKLKMVSSGINVKKPKSKKELQKQRRKYNQRTKKLRKLAVDTSLPEIEAPAETTDNIVLETKDNNPVPKPLKSNQKSKSKAKEKKMKQVVDSFFLPADGAASNDCDTSSDDEFSAPVDNTQVVIPKKKNRMGQRRRKKLVERQQIKTMAEKSKQHRGSRSRLSSNGNKRTKLPESNKTQVMSDEKIHPSWKAKQKLKSQQGITEFSGTKITFDDD